MSATPWLLVGRHLRAHWLRTALTGASVVVAIFLFCTLVSVVTSLDAAVTGSATNRVMTQSAVSLFVSLPRDYHSRIEMVDGAQAVTKFQWFGGIYQDPANFFAQFGVDHEVFFDMYAREFEIVQGPGGETGPEALQAVRRAMDADRRAAIIGTGLARDRTFGWQVGETVPLLGTVFPKADGSAWEFNIVGVYRPLKANFDDRTLFFRYDYLQETLDAGGALGPAGVGVFATNVAPGQDPAAVIAAIDRQFENGPQVTMSSTEAAFQAAFISMLGNLPFFVGTIGGAVVFAVIFSVVNTMLMSARQRLHEIGILKALGYSDAALGRLMLAESLALSVGGGLAGAGLARALSEPMRRGLGAFLPIYAVEGRTLALAVGISVLIGLVAGLAPALMAARLRPVQALRSEG